MQLPPLASAVVGLSAGAVLVLLLPSTLSTALGLLLGGFGVVGSLLVFERRAARLREQALAAIGEVKVRMATHAIRLDAMAQRVDQLPLREADAAPARATLNELTAEVGLLGDILQQVATTLAEHDDQLSAQRSKVIEPSAPAVLSPTPVVSAGPRVEMPPIDPHAAATARLDALAAESARAVEAQKARAAEERAALISAALSDGKVEVHLQPIVQLPQRRTRGYEALVRLRLDENTLLLPSEFLSVVEARGFGPTLDALVLTRSLAIARHLGAKGGGLFVTCNFSPTTWGSSKALAALARILERYREHAEHLVVEMPQAVFRALEPTSLGLLGAMSAMGLRFALDQVADIRFDPAALFDRGVRFVKVPAQLLQALALGETSSDIDPGDLSTLLSRASITLIAEEIEDNPTVADMIELGITHAQGLIFSPPRPVKPDVFAEPEAARQPLVEPPAEARPAADVVAYPQKAASEAPDGKPAVPERMSFRSVLRRASA